MSLSVTNDTSTTPLFVNRPDSGRPDILKPNGGSVTYNIPESGRYTVQSETGQAVAFSLKTPFEPVIKLAVAAPGGSPGGVIKFTNGGGPTYTVRTPNSKIVKVLPGASCEYEELGDYQVTFPDPTAPLEVYFPGTFNIGLNITVVNA